VDYKQPSRLLLVEQSAQNLFASYINVLMKPVNPYAQYGREQSEEEAKKIGPRIA
jgi:hypothetical protein